MQHDLPIHALREDFRRAWADARRLVVVAPTGSGKSTQVCQMLLEDGAASAGRVVVLQPRRVAARSVARRVADEMGVALGGAVGYQVRFDERLRDDTRIAFVTEGILLRWLLRDPDLAGVGAVLFDEFHERNALSDIALALCKQLQARARPDLRLVVMSATLDARGVAAYLGGPRLCPVLESGGREFPVSVHYQSWGDDGPVWERAAQRAVDILRSTDDGDVLVFMPGMAEIVRTIEDIRRMWRQGAGDPPAVLALHGEMSPADQDRAFAPAAGRRVIVATNVAETSVTLPGIRFVVDSGLARIARYDPERGVNTLHAEPISRASADQRAGRAGRLGPGECHRLWSLDQHETRPATNTPEMQRTELSSTVLLLRSLGVRDVARFDFLDPPDARRLQAADDLLERLGAVAGGEISAVGRRMSELPVHPRYARMLVEARDRGCAGEVALLAALVGGRDLFVRLGRDERIQRRNRESLVGKDERGSDYFALANGFRHAVASGFEPRACYGFGINPNVAREVAQAHSQLLAECGLPDADAPAVRHGRPPPDLVEAIQRCHLVGFIDHLAVRAGSGMDEYDLTGGRRGTLMEESVVGRSALIVASEVREVTARGGDRLTLLGVASAVRPEWVRELAPPGLNERVEHAYDRLNRRVVAGRVLRLSDLIIGGAPVERLDESEAARVLAEEFADQLNRLPQWGRLKPVLARAPAVSRDDVVAVLARAWLGATTFAEASKRDVAAAFAERFAPNTEGTHVPEHQDPAHP